MSSTLGARQPNLVKASPGGTVSKQRAMIEAEGIPVAVRNLTKSFGDFRAVDDISFDIAPGRILALLGPSGCGKTTTLRCIAGLEWPTSGDILVGDDWVTSVEQGLLLAPEHRNMGMVFQSYAIWPHMTVAQNVGYPLKVRRAPRKDIDQRVDETLDLVGLSGLGDRVASNLSGGQQQRVALARAIIARPRVLLFDEPLSNLDAKLRARMRFELLRLQREVGITSIFVTHDQGEAMAIADELVVMRDGRIEQQGDAKSIYLQPASLFVADFIGASNFLAGELVTGPDQMGIARLRLTNMPDQMLLGRISGEPVVGGRYLAVIRPEAFRLHDPGKSGDGVIRGTVTAVQYLGSFLDVRVSAAGSEMRLTVEPNRALSTGDEILLSVAPTDCNLLWSEGRDEAEYTASKGLTNA